MPGFHLRTDQSLHDALSELARAEGLSLNTYFNRLARAEVNRRQSLALDFGLDWRASDDVFAAAAQQALLALTPDEQRAARACTTPEHAVRFVALCASRRRRNAGSSKPPAQGGSKPPAQRASTPNAWRSAAESTRALGNPIALAARKADALPTEFMIFRAGENRSTKGSIMFDDRAARLVILSHKEHGTRLMIDLEHQSLFGLAGDASDARGWADLEVRSGALYAVNVEWCPDGARRLREKTQIYTSPAFLVEWLEGDAMPRVEHLINVAITALPATHGLAPLVASRR